MDQKPEWRCRDDLPLHRHSFIFKFFCVACYLIKRANLLLGQLLILWLMSAREGKTTSVLYNYGGFNDENTI